MAIRIEGTHRIVPVLEDFMNPRAFESYKRAVAKNMIKNDLINHHKLPDTIYHFTKKTNVDSILENGLKAGIDGGVFVGEDMYELKDYLVNNIVGSEYIRTLRGKVTKNTEELEDYVILEFRAPMSRAVKWYKRIDNHNILFYHGDLNITDVTIHEVGGEDNASN